MMEYTLYAYTFVIVKQYSFPRGFRHMRTNGKENIFLRKARNARARNSMLRNILDRVETLVISLSKDKKLPFMSDKELAASP